MSLARAEFASYASRIKSTFQHFTFDMGIFSPYPAGWLKVQGFKMLKTSESGGVSCLS